MSGFEYHLVCRACGLTSATYPWLHDSVVAPTVMVLPTADRAARAFGVIEIPVRWRLTEPVELAAALSTDERTVLPPRMGGTAIATPCPRCGEAAVEHAFGGPPRVHVAVDGLDALIAATRAIEPGAGAWYRVEPGGARVHCVRDPDRYEWHLAGVEAAALLDALCEELARRGARITIEMRHRARARLVEHAAP